VYGPGVGAVGNFYAAGSVHVSEAGTIVNRCPPESLLRGTRSSLKVGSPNTSAGWRYMGLPLPRQSSLTCLPETIGTACTHSQSHPRNLAAHDRRARQVFGAFAGLGPYAFSIAVRSGSNAYKTIGAGCKGCSDPRR